MKTTIAIFFSVVLYVVSIIAFNLYHNYLSKAADRDFALVFSGKLEIKLNHEINSTCISKVSTIHHYNSNWFRRSKLHLNYIEYFKKVEIIRDSFLDTRSNRRKLGKISLLVGNYGYCPVSVPSIGIPKGTDTMRVISRYPKIGSDDLESDDKLWKKYIKDLSKMVSIMNNLAIDSSKRRIDTVIYTDPSDDPFYRH